MSNAEQHTTFVRYAAVAAVAMLAVGGCAVGTRVQITTAETLDALVGALGQAVDEYHLEVRGADVEKRRAAVDAFAARIRADHKDDEAATRHVMLFNQALDSLQHDAEAENSRHGATLENLRVVTEAAAGLRRIAIESMTLNDEVRRYLGTRLAEHAQPRQSERN